MISTIFLLFTMCSSSYGTINEQPLTGICKKSIERRYIHTGTHTWDDMLRLSGLIVDKSLLLKSILDRNHTLVQINCPRKFGKSMNLQMIGKFLQLEVNKLGERLDPADTTNHLFFIKGEYEDKDQTIHRFSPIPLISKESSIVQNYMGKYSVININFQGTWGHTYDEVIKAIGEKIRAAFKEHKYVLRWLKKIIFDKDVNEGKKQKAREDFENFVKFSNKTSTPEDLVGSLVLLSRLLHEQFDQKVFILFDDYDRILKSMSLDTIYDRQEVQQVIGFLKRFFETTFGPSNGHLHKAILTGVYLLSNDEIFANLPLAKYYYLRDLLPFYGFVKHEVDSIFDHAALSTDLRATGHDIYDGYKGGNNFDVSIYNPLSIVAFSNEKSIKTYWSLSEDLPGKLLKYALKDDNFAIFFKEIINLRGANVAVMQLTIENFEPLRPMLFNTTEDILSHTNTILWYLYINGYFTVQSFQRKDNETMLDLRIPNKEITEDLSLAVISLFYKEKFRVSHTSFEAATEYLGHLMNRDEYTLILLVKTLDAIITRVVRLDGAVSTKIETEEQKQLVNSTINFIAMRIPLKYDFKIEPTDRGKGKDPDIIMYNEKRIVVIQINLDALKSNYALINAKRYKNVVKSKPNLQGIPEIKFIGIGVSPFKTVFARTETQSIDIWH